MKLITPFQLGLLMLGVVASASAVELPTQKPGLWQMTVKGSQMPGGARTYQMCQDAALLAKAKASAESHLKHDCTTTSSVRKIGDTWISDADCKMSGMHIVSHTVTTIHGDDQYHSEITSKMDSPAGKKTSKTTVDNKRLGACKPGQKVGVPIAG